MSKLYLCAHTSKLETKAIIDALVGEEAIKDWFFSIRGTFFFRSDLSARELSERIIARYGTVRHFVVDITASEKWGAMPKQQWEKILQKKL
jgi:hypothetical protein